MPAQHLGGGTGAVCGGERTKWTERTNVDGDFPPAPEVGDEGKTIP